jgi:hypothetical protein
MKYYILRKDLPFIPSGTPYFLNKDYEGIDKNSYLPKILGRAYERFAIHKDYVENNPEWFYLFETSEEPPLGLVPLWVRHEQRLAEIDEAIERYDKVLKPIPKEWIGERESLSVWVRDRKLNK